jgi:hypothetical protein
MIGFIAPYTFTTQDYRQYSAITILHTFQFTVIHALEFSVFTSCILEPDLSQSHYNFKSTMKSSFHSLIHSLPLFCNSQFQRLNTIPILCSQAHILAGCHPKTWVFTTPLLLYCSLLTSSVSFYNHSAWIPQKTQPLLLRRHIYWSVI